MGFFIRKDDVIEVSIYAYENSNKDIEAVETLDEVPAYAEGQKLTFKFRRPNFADQKKLFSDWKTNLDGEPSGLNPMLLNCRIMEALLVDWDLKDEEGNKVSCTQDKIAELHPTIGRVAVNKAQRNFSF